MTPAAAAEWQGWHRLLLRDDRHGPLPALLLALTVVSGLVDAVSILSLGRVFVANMTGNVVFIGFAVAGAPGFSLAASICSLAGFLFGAAASRGPVARLRARRGHLLLAGSVVELLCMTTGLLLLVLAPDPLPAGVRDATAGIAAVALGTQNAVVRALAVPDLTTTVLTLTLTGLVADARRGLSPTSMRRLLAVITMFTGAAVGALLVLQVSPAAGMGAAVGVLLVVAVAAWSLRGPEHSWHRPPT